jgi:hypothetical protein
VGDRGDRESTHALIDRARDGDQQALERLFARQSSDAARKPAQRALVRLAEELKRG